MSEVLDGPLTYEAGIKLVDEQYIQGIRKYLKTGQLDKSHKNYIQCYSYEYFRF